VSPCSSSRRRPWHRARRSSRYCCRFPPRLPPPGARRNSWVGYPRDALRAEELLAGRAPAADLDEDAAEEDLDEDAAAANLDEDAVAAGLIEEATAEGTIEEAQRRGGSG
jgi:hypothetical protein